MNLDNLLAIVGFLGKDMTEEDAIRLADEARKLSILDREELLARDEIAGTPLFMELSMMDGEMGSFSHY